MHTSRCSLTDFASTLIWGRPVAEARPLGGFDFCDAPPRELAGLPEPACLRPALGSTGGASWGVL